jgi:hypothetical protein
MEAAEERPNHPFRFRRDEASEELNKDEKYSKFLQLGKEQGYILDNLIYPSLFGPNAELLGLAVAKDILPGEILLSAPCSARNDYKTIMASEVGETI